MVDDAIAAGRAEHLIEHAAEQVASGIRARLAVVAERRAAADTTVEAGRAYVAAYVELLHYVEKLHGTEARN